MSNLQDRKCPLKNEQDNIESAQMFSTALEKGTMIVATKNFNFSNSFFISIFLAADDSKCHLPAWEGNVTSALHRQKSISIKLTLVDKNWKYYAKGILVPISMMLAVVFVGLVIFWFKLYKRDLCCSRFSSCCSSAVSLSACCSSAASLSACCGSAASDNSNDDQQTGKQDRL